MPTLPELVLDQGCDHLLETIDGRSLSSLMFGNATAWRDEVVAEIFFEGARAPGILIRCGTKKYVHWEGRPYSLFDLQHDPPERENLVADPAYSDEIALFNKEVHERRPVEPLTEKILLKQRYNALVHKALMTGELTTLDFQPFDDASKRDCRGHGNWHKAEGQDFLRFDSKDIPK